jgi:serine/threonine protein kinase
MREIRVLQTCHHPNIVHLKKVVTGSKPDSIFLVFEYCSHDLGHLVDMMPRPFSQSEVKCLMLQVCPYLTCLRLSSVVLHATSRTILKQLNTNFLNLAKQ